MGLQSTQQQANADDNGDGTSSTATHFSKMIAAFDENQRGAFPIAADILVAFQNSFPAQRHVSFDEFGQIFDEAKTGCQLEALKQIFHEDAIGLPPKLDMRAFINKMQEAMSASSNATKTRVGAMRKQLILDAFANAEEIAEPANGVIKHGRIYKKEWNGQRYHEKVVVIKNGYLLYYEPKEFESAKKLFRPKGFLDLVGCSAHVLDTGVFAIVATEGTFLFAAPNATHPSRKLGLDWIAAVKKAQFVGYKQVVANAIGMHRMYSTYDVRSKQLLEASAEVFTIKNNREDNTIAREEAEKRLAETKLKCTELQQTVHTQEQTIAARDKELTQTKTTLEQREHTIATLEKVRDDLLSTVASLRTDVQKRDATIAQLTTKLTEQTEMTRNMGILNSLLFQQGLRPAERMIISSGKKKNAEVAAAHKKLQAEQEKVLRLERQLGDLLQHQAQLQAKSTDEGTRTTAIVPELSTTTTAKITPPTTTTSNGSEAEVAQLKNQLKEQHTLCVQLKTDVTKAQQARDQALGEVKLLLKSLKQMGSKPQSVAPLSVQDNRNDHFATTTTATSSSATNPTVFFVNGASGAGDGVVKPVTTTKIRVVQVV
eukprot:c12568_g1_i1.p1 GENE.c12568_g1_i1~~c12568_g1_i1.p1  ORF type:complete len:625 (+),score=185.24 c12568_g1_i1:76-1875(+)